MSRTTKASLNACQLGQHAIVDWYNHTVEDNIIFANPVQRHLIDQLQQFSNDGLGRSNKDWKKHISPWFGKKNNSTSGLYIHGGVGCGKTFLMDGFYLQLRLVKKLRVHFHSFMRHLHEDLKKQEQFDDSLTEVANRLIANYELICFDEFHVSDITDAMLLGRLLEKLVNGGVRFVMTSNYAPDDLYPNGLARHRFLPTIGFIKSKMTILPLDSGEDYRQRLQNNHSSYFTPCNKETMERAEKFFSELSGGIYIEKNIQLSKREINVVIRSSDCVWLDFKVLCMEARSKSDYLQLASRFSFIFLSNIPTLDDENLSEATRRFTWLIDILYDSNVRFVMIADVPLANLYGQSEGGESGRTLSRLIEMQHS